MRKFLFSFALYSARSRSSSQGSSSSSSCSSSSSSCSSCSHNRRNRRRRLASIASIPTIHQQQSHHNFPEPDAQSISVNTIPTAATPTNASVQQAAQSTVDPYAPAPNLIRVERIKDVNSGQDVFIRWVSDTNSSLMMNDEQQSSVPQQVYSTQPPINHHFQQHKLDRELPNHLERLALEDEHLRRSLVFDDRPPSIASNYEQRKHKKRHQHHDLNNQSGDYEVVNGYFEDRHGRRRPVKLDRSQVKTVKDYRHLPKDIVHSSAPQNDRRHRHRDKSFIQSPIPEPQHAYPTSSVPPANLPLIRPFGPAFLPRGPPFYPPQTFNTTPLFSRPNFLNRAPISRPPFWYRPM